MKLNLSEEWYAREFRKDAEEPVVAVSAGRANVPTLPAEEPAAQEENKRLHEMAPRATQLPPNNMQ